MEFQSSFQTGRHNTHKCVVYDRRDGRIVLVHDFIGDGKTGVFAADARDERERLALDSARKRYPEPGHLQALHLAPDFAWDRHSLYRVDVQSGRIEVRAKLPEPVLWKHAAPGREQS